MKTLAELIERRKVLVAEMESIVATGKTEVRKLSTVETRAFDAAKVELTALDADIAKRNQTPPGPTKIEMKTEAKNFSLLKAVRSAVNNEAFDEATLNFINAGKEEMRKSNVESTGRIVLPFEHRAIIQAGAAGSGQENISEEKLNIIEPLRAALVTVQAGATFMTGLKGDISIPAYAGSTALWKGEGVTAVDGAGATSEVTMTPKRLTAFIDISKQFLAQDSTGAEDLFMADIVAAISGKLEATIFGKEDVSATQPLGMFFAAPSIKGSASWANIVGLETAVDTANALKTCKYITNAAGRGILKKTPKVANQALYLMDPDGTLNSYPTLVTNHVASALQVGGDEYGIVFGNWADLLIGQWGGLDITVDTVTRAHLAEVRIVINAYFDAVQRRTASFKTGSLK